MDPRCVSIKSKKNPTVQCSSPATRGEFCARHFRSRILWTSAIPPRPPFTRSQKLAASKILRFIKAKTRLSMRMRRGPAIFTPEISHNDKDLYSLESITTIPRKYHFSYADANKHVWTFDVRFLVQCLQHGESLKNAFSQEEFASSSIRRFHALTKFLRLHQIPIVYVDTDELTPEQIWNQKVIDVFLQLGALGYGANILWFESLTIRGHQLFYRNLYRLWNTILALSDIERELIIPGFNSGRAPLFRWHPIALEGEAHDIKWWRKQTLTLMSTFITRSTDRANQGCGALYVLTALANSHPRVADAYPWLVAE